MSTDRPAPIAPEWLVQDAEVVVIFQAATGPERVKVTEIEKVSKYSFRVVDQTDRFRIDDQTARVGQFSRYKVYSRNSVEGQQALVRQARRELLDAVDNEYRQLKRDPGRFRIGRLTYKLERLDKHIQDYGDLSV